MDQDDAQEKRKYTRTTPSSKKIPLPIPTNDPHKAERPTTPKRNEDALEQFRRRNQPAKTTRNADAAQTATEKQTAAPTTAETTAAARNKGAERTTN